MQEEEQKPEQEQPETDVAADQPAADEAPAEPSASEAPDQPAADQAPAEQAPAPAQADQEPLTPKQARKLERSSFTGPAGPERTPADRDRERRDARSRKAAERRRWRAKRRERSDGAAPMTPEPAPEAPQASEARKVRRGIVVSAKPDKTITVRIDVMRSHPRYGKVVRNTSTLHAHDERNQATEGDVVRVVECRPLSRTKRWRLLEVVEKAR